MCVCICVCMCMGSGKEMVAPSGESGKGGNVYWTRTSYLRIFICFTFFCESGVNGFRTNHCWNIFPGESYGTILAGDEGVRTVESKQRVHLVSFLHLITKMNVRSFQP